MIMVWEFEIGLRDGGWWFGSCEWLELVDVFWD